MVATLIQPEQHLSVQAEYITTDTITIRCLDWNRDRFDIEFGLHNGTTYNSHLIRGEKIALVDTSHAKFRQLYLDTLFGLLDPHSIDYLVVSHTEPDHSALAKYLLQINPSLIVVGSKMAIQFLEGFVHRNFKRQIIKSGDLIDLGKGHVLEFVSAPNLHWPDTILTYDWGTQTLYTCDVFGMHYCSHELFDVNLEDIEADYEFYYKCLMAANARSVVGAFKRMDKLGAIEIVANGHGPILKHHVSQLIDYYRNWSTAQKPNPDTVAIFYVSGYGDSDRLAQSIARGIAKTGMAVEFMDAIEADPQEVRALAEQARGLVIGLPPASGEIAETAATTLSTILAFAHPKQVVGFFESYGENDEPIDPIAVKFREMGIKQAFPSIRIKQAPTKATYQHCEEAGTDMGQLLIQEKSIKKRKAIESDLDKAMGRLSSGLYIITAQQEELKGAMLASWVNQASFEPLGVTVAVAKERAIESLLQVGDSFVLNILEEGNYRHLMRHFIKRFKPGQDRFAGVEIQEAKNGSPILSDALAYLECQVVDRMEVNDHWLVYCHVSEGRVANSTALTAIHHRKVGNYY
ncbi:MAG: diflavin flavoprotein [Cyanobacteria bacterium P01_E01_bin.42]